MPLYIYTPSIPFASNSPSTDQPNMQTNTDSVNGILGEDHYSFNNGNGGIHKQVRLIDQSAPGFTGASGVLYSGTINGQSWPIWQNSLGSTSLVSGPTSAATNGYVYLPGGIIMQWGQATAASGGSVSFPIAFPTNVFSIQATLFVNATNRHFLYVRSTSNTAFIVTVLDSGGSGETNTFKWLAIGN